jgi:copper chaperone CopZ
MDKTNTELATQGPHSTAAQAELWETKIFGVGGMTSERSVNKIEHVLRRHPGVMEIQIDRENATATVTYDPRQTNMAELHELLLHSGYKPPAKMPVEVS